jgi:hypothetical protein
VDGKLQHETAVEMARELLGIISNCLREEEHRDAFDEFYRVCNEGIERFTLTKEFLETTIELEGDRPCK